MVEIAGSLMALAAVLVFGALCLGKRPMPEPPANQRRLTKGEDHD